MESQLALFPGAFQSAAEIEVLISPLYSQLWRMIREPFEDLLLRRSEDHAFRILDEGESAQWLRPQIVAKAKDLFDQRSDVTIEKRRSQLFIKYRDEVAITPKKFKRRWLSNGLTFSSYETRQNEAYWRQMHVDGFDAIPRVIVGYQFIEEMTNIRILIGYPNGKRLRFCYLMPDQDGIVSAQPAIAETTIAEDRGYEVRAKRGAKKSGSQK